MWLFNLIGGWRGVLIAGAIAGLTGAFGYTYHAGYSSAATAWSLKYTQREVQIASELAAEVSRVAQANALAKAIEAKRIEQLEADRVALEQKIKELSDEAAADPDRDHPALSADSGMRIDSVH